MKIQQIDAAYRSRRPGDYPADRMPEVAFLGRSNVGKSSLINSLVGRRKLAATSRDPGKTRAINWYRLIGSNKSCFFVDLPGYGYAKVSKHVRESLWAKLIDTYLSSDQPMVLAIQLLDIRRDGPTALDEQMIGWLRETGVPHVFVLTKSDKLGKGRRAAAVRQFANVLETTKGNNLIPFSAVTGEGRKRLWSLIDQCLVGATSSSYSVTLQSENDDTRTH
ncbi:MAG: ribosome biogenesis GTP-binding protein YihA/YsxC [Acidobacteriota bacterium]